MDIGKGRLEVRYRFGTRRREDERNLTVGVLSRSEQFNIWAAFPHRGQHYDDMFLALGGLSVGKNFEVNVLIVAWEACRATWILSINSALAPTLQKTSIDLADFRAFRMSLLASRPTFKCTNPSGSLSCYFVKIRADVFYRACRDCPCGCLANGLINLETMN